MNTFTKVFNTSSKAVSYNEGLRKYMIGVYNFMTLALGISSLVSLIVVKSGLIRFIANPTISLILILIEFGIVMYLSSSLEKMSSLMAKKMFFAYAAINGLVLSTIFLIYSGADILRAFLSATLTFGAMSIYGYTAKKDLSQYSSLVTMGLVGLIIASLVNIFMRSHAFEYIISAFGVLLFTFLIGFNTQRIKNMYYYSNPANRTNIAVYAAFVLYLDFINLFLYLLRFLSNSKNRD